jgi:hypothetical protein
MSSLLTSIPDEEVMKIWVRVWIFGLKGENWRVGRCVQLYHSLKEKFGSISKLNGAKHIPYIINYFRGSPVPVGFLKFIGIELKIRNIFKPVND